MTYKRGHDKSQTGTSFQKITSLHFRFLSRKLLSQKRTNHFQNYDIISWVTLPKSQNRNQKSTFISEILKIYTLYHNHSSPWKAIELRNQESTFASKIFQIFKWSVVSYLKVEFNFTTWNFNFSFNWIFKFRISNFKLLLNFGVCLPCTHVRLHPQFWNMPTWIEIWKPVIWSLKFEISPEIQAFKFSTWRVEFKFQVWHVCKWYMGDGD